MGHFFWIFDIHESPVVSFLVRFGVRTLSILLESQQSISQTRFKEADLLERHLLRTGFN